MNLREYVLIHAWKLPRLSFAALAGLLVVATSAVWAGPSDNEVTPGAGRAHPSFWDQKYMLGDRDGERPKLEKEGVTFDFNNIGDFLTDVTGSQEHHLT